MFIGVKYCVGFIILVASVTSFASLTINLTDANGNAVPNAVISIPNKLNPHDSDAEFPTAIMDQIDYQFVPKVLIDNKGQKVDFPNSDDVRHHVYSFSQPNAFEIKMYQGSDAKPIDFRQQGIVVLGCNIHDSMIGYIYVADNEHAYLSDASGQVLIPQDVLEQSSDDTININVWHPQLSSTHVKRVMHSIDRTKTDISISLSMYQHTPVSEHNMPANDNSKFNRGMK